MRCCPTSPAALLLLEGGEDGTLLFFEAGEDDHAVRGFRTLSARILKLELTDFEMLLG